MALRRFSGVAFQVARQPAVRFGAVRQLHYLPRQTQTVGTIRAFRTIPVIPRNQLYAPLGVRHYSSYKIPDQDYFKKKEEDDKNKKKPPLFFKESSMNFNITGKEQKVWEEI